MKIRLLLVSAALVAALAGAWAQSREDRQKKVLQSLPSQPDVLVNLQFGDLPSTTDMIQLGRTATPAIINGLINSMDANVRGACAAVLTATRDPKARDALVDALEDPEIWIRALAIKALGQVEGTQSTAPLLAVVRKERGNESLKLDAIGALGRLGDPAAVQPLLDEFEARWDDATQRALWDLRRHLSSRQLRTVVVGPLTVKDPNVVPDSVFARSIELAGELKMREAVKPLMKRFGDADRHQNAIVHALGKIGDRDAVKFLNGLLDRSAEARLLNNVVFALDRLKEDPKPFLREALSDRRAYIRFNAAFVAGDLKQAALLPELKTALADRNDYVRSEVAVALGKIGDRGAVEALEAASREENPIVRRDALLALARIDFPAYRDRVLDELATSPVDSVRTRAVDFLSSQADPALASRIVNTLDPTGWRDRSLGLAYLDQFFTLDSESVTGWLLRVAAGDSDRDDALRLLGRLKDERARFALRQWLSHPTGEENQLLRAMGRYQDQPSAAHARQWLAANSVATQLHAAYLLAQVGEAGGMDRLVAAIETAPLYLKRTSARLLTELDPAKLPEIEPALRKLLKHEDVYVRIYASRALIERPDAEAFAVLWLELSKRIPFIRDEVLDVFERAPKASRDSVMATWLAFADPMLRRDLERIQARNP